MVCFHDLFVCLFGCFVSFLVNTISVTGMSKLTEI